jgi:hypothetical protein|tara:strand:+ start:3320 stop:3631 length:312 start_codon:yes stop_codon:yes gene_type:complete
MSGAINLTPYTVTATGTVTTNSTRIAGFTVMNKGAADDQGFTMYNLASDGSVGTQIMEFKELSSVTGGASSFTQTYSGNTGIKFDNGVYVCADAHIKLFMTAF